ncbi:MAG: iron-sulfur cluster-binding protein [Caldilineaceae bacterium]|nr:iron-sulfur cluster-binding protein [Caldilineaceae bacterium]
MSVDIHAPYKERVDAALHDKHLRIALDRATSRMKTQRADAMAAIDGERLRTQVRKMKSYVLRNLPDLLETLESNLTANGAHVHWAADGEEADRIILDIARQANVQKAVKAKSMTSEEIHLNGILQQAGIKVVETDLGEYIIQLADEPPSHIIAPVIHKRIEDISQVFQRELDMPPTMDPSAMTGAARQILRREFLSADLGISGCNFAIAETGTICIVTNEGNGRMVSSMPRVYIAVMGIEKLVPTVEDAFLQYQALCRSATGQQCSVYLSMTSGPRRADHPDGPEEFHVVLMDNGRLNMLARGYGEALMCVRCGACLNACPVYREIGGHAYGSTYSGPIGAVISPLLNTDVTDADKLPHASSLCGACRDACPVKIDLPRLLLNERADQVAEGDTAWFDRQAIRAFADTMKSPGRYAAAASFARTGSNLLAGMSGGNITFMPPPFSAWTQSRDFPPFAKKSFRRQWRERQERRKRIGNEGQRSKIED